MSVDIEGMIEICKQDPMGPWIGVEELGDLYEGRCYDLFGCLFGVRNYANFAPLFADRGLPTDVSEQTLDLMRDEHAEEGDSPWWSHPSWCSPAELAAIDHGELALEADERVHEFNVIDGVEVFSSKSTWCTELANRGVYARLKNESSVRVGNNVYRRVVLRRGEVLKSFVSVLNRMADLAQKHGPERVRLIVWFGS